MIVKVKREGLHTIKMVKGSKALGATGKEEWSRRKKSPISRGEIQDQNNKGRPHNRSQRKKMTIKKKVTTKKMVLMDKKPFLTPLLAKDS